jgi:flagellar biosynthesis/type III secretory pathway M-ring protein FliF/YscJ
MLLAVEQPHPQWLNHLLTMVPWVIIFLFLWFFIFQFLKRERRRQKELDEARTRAAALQQQLDQTSKAKEPMNRGG